MQDTDILPVMEVLDNLETLFVEVAGKLAPWLAPLLSAVVVGQAMMQPPFNWNIYLAVLTGAAIELSGISSLSTALTLWAYWGEQPDQAKPSLVPLAAAVLCAAGYLATALSLAVVLKMVAGLEVLAYGLFVLLALTSAVTLALRQDHQKRTVASRPAHPRPVCRRPPVPKTRPKPANEPVAKPVPDQTDAERRANLDRANAARDLPTQADYNRAAALRAEGLTWPQVAGRLDVSSSTAKRWAAQAHPVNRQNGRGLQ